MKSIYKFSVKLALPEPLRPLLEIAQNLWWSWNPEAIQLFKQADPVLWEKTRHNPVQMMGFMSLAQYERLMATPAFMNSLRHVHDELKRYLNSPSWYSTAQPDTQDATIAYFSAEFGLHESLPLYSGGLGILSGDHLKSASDLGLPLIGVGLFYRHGYFSQYLTADGWQMESYPLNDFFNLPAHPVEDTEGKPVMVSVPMQGRDVWARVWRIQVGRVPLFLLDADVDRNSERDRAITAHLYGGGLETRIEQEILLGIGGVRALAALNRRPTVCHINEGHSAFLGLERIRRLVVESKLSFDVAREVVTHSNVFTTHTPVPAGIDKFPSDMVKAYFRAYAPEMGLTVEELLRLGQENPNNAADPFNMAVLALRLSGSTNGVSALHGEVSRRMWSGLWPDVPESEIPIRHVTNGVHSATWFSTEIAELYRKHLGNGWLEHPTDPGAWEKVAEIPDEELWRVHTHCKGTLIRFARKRLKEQLDRSGAHPQEFTQVDEVLDPDALTIGFARRFATYKRATLLFRDIERLKRLVTSADRPVQIVFAGKAHPRDNQGKEFIRQIIQVSRQPEFRRRVVFIQDYDILVARHMVQGVDIWLNNPRRPLEASGTSGMKSTANGVLNFSVLDGWWCEGYNGKNGWVIGEGEDYEDSEYQDSVESHALYNLLEKTIIPLYYERDGGGIPRGWTAAMKESILSICPFFNTNRMVEDYARDYYAPSHKRGQRLVEKDYAGAREYCGWKKRTAEGWSGLRVVSCEADVTGGIRIGESLAVRATVALGSMSPADIEVQAYHGRLDEKGSLTGAKVVALSHNGTATGSAVTGGAATGGVATGGLALFEGRIPCDTTGERGLMIRVLPKHEAMPNPFCTGLIKWWEG